MRLNNIIKWAAAAVAALAISACNDDFNEIKTLQLGRCLQPLNLSGSVDINSGVDATLRWDLAKGTERYRLVVFTVADSTSVLDITLEPREVPFQTALEADGTYSFKVCGVAEGRDSSRWAIFNGSLQTYAIKDNLFPAITAKSASSVTINWSSEVEDYRDLTHIQLTPTSGGEPIVYTLTDADKNAASAVITDLAASTEYTVVLFFKSASRGGLSVWTNPAQGDLVKITTAEALKTALEQGDDVYLGLEGSPYELDQIAPAKGFRLIGEADADGKRPVIKVNMTIGREATADVTAVDYAGGDIRLENICFDGRGGRKFIFDHKTGDITIDKIEVVNCEILGYNGGLLYQSTNPKLTLNNLLVEGCEIHDLQDVKGEGEFVDARKNAEFGTLTFRNNTLWNSGRALVRIDNSSTSINHVVLENNTFKHFDVGQNKGLLYIRCPWSEMTVKRNLFLWEEGADTRFATTGKTDVAAENARRPATINASKNYFFEAGPIFLPETAASSFTNFTRGQIAATELSTDPCVNSKGNVFNLTNQTLVTDNIGATKWHTAYVEPTEDLTLGTTSAPHTWDFTDATLFAGDLQKSKVRDSLLMVASETCSMNLDGVLKFNAASAVDQSTGVPTEGFAAFKVKEAGSVLMKVSEAAGMVVIATGDTEMGSATAKAGIGAASGVQKVILDGIDAETMVYIYTTGAATIEALAWSPDTEGVNTALSAPKPTIDVKSVFQGDSTTISVSWEAVKNAASYEITYRGGTPIPTEECSFVIDSIAVSKLEAGSYTVSVVAMPASGDLYNTPSDAATVAFAVLAAPEEGGETTYEETTISTDFSSAAWQTAFGKWEGATSGSDCTNPFTATVDEFTLKIVKSGEKNRYGSNYIQLGGAGNKAEDAGTANDENRTIQFTAPAAGTLTVVTSTTGNTADLTRAVSVSVNGGAKQTKDGAGVAASDTHAELVFEIDEAGKVLVFPEAGLRFYSLSFTYMKAVGGGEAPAAKEEHFSWDFSSADWQTAFGTWEGATSGSDCTNPFTATVDGLTLKIVKSGDKNRFGAAYIQLGGAGNNSPDYPENRTLSFTCTTAGTLTVTTSTTGNTADVARSVSVSVDGGTAQTKDGAGVAANATHAELSFEIEAGRVLIWPEAGLRFYKVTFDSK
ncbi:MAG: DUF4957 domain-containing protein [Bacteroidales bacterium]|nr:DUF4957 domain-containing protein [Bacteroidales bacterium]